MSGLQPAALLSPTGTSPSRGVCCSHCTPPRSGRGSEQPSRRGAGTAAAPELHSRGSRGGDTPARAVTRQPAREATLRDVSPLLPGPSRQRPVAGAVSPLGSSGIRASLLLPEALAGPGGLTAKSCSHAAAAEPLPPARREKGAASAQSHPGIARHGRSRARVELSPARAPEELCRLPHWVRRASERAASRFAWSLGSAA